MFSVSLSVSAKQQIAVLYRRARRANFEALAENSLFRAQQRLRTDPKDFGDPLYNLRFTPGTFRLAVSPPFILHYVLYEEANAVFVTSVMPVPPSVLEND
jgi:hypothetical protein